MMALNRYRLKHLKEQNHRGARRAGHGCWPAPTA